MAGSHLSVVIPIYNGAATLERTLASLAAQDGAADLEVIAVDQASEDGSGAILERFCEHLPLRILSAPESRNWMRNVNIGLGRATAPFVSILHQDDVWSSGRARAMLALAERYPQAELWLHPAWFLDDADRRLGRFSPPFGRRERLIGQGAALETLLVQNTVALPAAMVRRETLLDLGGLSETLWYTADWDLWLRLLRRGPLAWSPERLAGFRIHARSQTVVRSGDLTEFEAQLRTPLAEHIEALDPAAVRRVRPLAEAALELNLWLAARFHGTPRPLLPLLGRIATLGPLRWPAFLSRSQIIARVGPRLRVLWQRWG